jgi:hydroxymethylglutaryl-CoA reductase (NADPH)
MFGLMVCELMFTREAIRWLNDRDNFELVKEWFDSTSRFAQLQKLGVTLVDKQVHIRFVATTGDAMGMNMLSKVSNLLLSTREQKLSRVLLL